MYIFFDYIKLCASAFNIFWLYILDESEYLKKSDG